VRTRCEALSIQAAAGAMPGVLWVPEERGRVPGVLVLMDAYGLTPHVERVTAQLAASGYAALAPDLYYRFQRRHFPYENPHRTADGLMRTIALSEAPEERAKDDRTLLDVVAALDALAVHPCVEATQLAVIGFGMGGHLAFLSACRLGGRLRAGAVFCGTRLVPLLSEVRSLDAPLLLLFAGRDRSTSPAQIDRMRAELDYFEKPYRLESYGEADDGFYCEDREAHVPELAVLAWDEAVGWFRKYF
jgi:dienelactone hydrolase